MIPHPAIWPAIAGALIGFPVVVLSAIWLVRNWRRLGPRVRWALFAALALFETAYWLNVYAWLVEPNLLVVRRVEIVSENWHGAPLTIAALGDTHVASPHVSVERMSRVVARINALRPDLVVLLGDYAGSHEPAAERAARENSDVLNGVATFAALDARYGAAAVIGNHDSWYDRPAIARELEAAGVATLWNRHVVIARPSGRFVIAGLADLDTGDPDYARAVDGAPEGAGVIVLTHSPDVFESIPEGPAIILAAHTHCGQVYLPFLGRPIIPSAYGQRFACGLVREGPRVMFVTGGLGTSILPLRFMTPPEIALITLRAAP